MSFLQGAFLALKMSCASLRSILVGEISARKQLDTPLLTFFPYGGSWRHENPEQSSLEQLLGLSFQGYCRKNETAQHGGLPVIEDPSHCR